MPRIRVVCVGLVAAMAIALALGGARAQTAPNAPVGKPLALLAGLRPPHEASHAVHPKAAHVAIRKTAARKSHHVKTAAEHGRHVAARKFARQRHEASEPAGTASAFAEEPPAQATPAGIEPGGAAAPADGMTAPTPTVAPVSGPVSENAPSPSGPSLDPTAVKVQMLRIAAPNQDTGPAPGAQQDAPPVAASNDFGRRSAACRAANRSCRAPTSRHEPGRQRVVDRAGPGGVRRRSGRRRGRLVFDRRRAGADVRLNAISNCGRCRANSTRTYSPPATWEVGGMAPRDETDYVPASYLASIGRYGPDLISTFRRRYRPLDPDRCTRIFRR